MVVSTAEMAKECLGTSDRVYLNRPHKIIVKHLASNSGMLGFSQYGHYWREIRVGFSQYGQYWREICETTTIKLLSNHQVDMFKNVRISEIRLAIKRVSGAGSESVDMKEWFNNVSLNSIVRLVSGNSLKKNCKGEEYNRCVKAIRDFFELAAAFVPADAVPALRWLNMQGIINR